MRTTQIVQAKARASPHRSLIHLWRLRVLLVRHCRMMVKELRRALIPSIGDFVGKWLTVERVSPFAGRCGWSGHAHTQHTTCTHQTTAPRHTPTAPHQHTTHGSALTAPKLGVEHSRRWCRNLPAPKQEQHCGLQSDKSCPQSLLPGLARRASSSTTNFFV